MDAIDKGILNDLVENCRITYRELATKYTISSSAIKKRVKKLEETGIITGYRLQVSSGMVGVNLLYGMLTTDGSQDETEFVNTLGGNNKIIAAASYTGGNYALIAEFRNSQDLWEVGAFLRSFDCVHAIETHQLLSQPGYSMDFSKLHLRVLKTLRDDPRMSIVDIADQSGLTARRVRKLVDEIQEGKAIKFSAFIEHGAAGSIPFLMRLTWDERATDHTSIISWLQETFSLSLWETYISVESPIIVCLLIAETLTEVDNISRTTRRHEHIPTVTVQIAKHHRYFPGIREELLEQLLEST
ncbi:MAG: winged helix-turn-helix transcriptional regulator [Candidatus Thorarchaeota archaeon]